VEFNIWFLGDQEFSLFFSFSMLPSIPTLKDDYGKVNAFLKMFRRFFGIDGKNYVLPPLNTKVIRGLY
jgi:hypothetical protein